MTSPLKRQQRNSAWDDSADEDDCKIDAFVKRTEDFAYDEVIAAFVLAQ